MSQKSPDEIYLVGRQGLWKWKWGHKRAHALPLPSSIPLPLIRIFREDTLTPNPIWWVQSKNGKTYPILIQRGIHRKGPPQS